MSNQCCKELTAKIKEWCKENKTDMGYPNDHLDCVDYEELLQFLDTLNEVVGLPNTSQGEKGRDKVMEHDIESTTGEEK